VLYSSRFISISDIITRQQLIVNVITGFKIEVKAQRQDLFLSPPAAKKEPRMIELNIHMNGNGNIMTTFVD
jgi:hypothetical protein